MSAGLAGAGAVFRRELDAAVRSPVAWVACAAFVVALNAGFFFIGFPIGDLSLPSFWTGRVASLEVLFAWLPLVFALLAPALTMGSWAEERRSGTDELLLTQPVSIRAIVAGKFLAAWLLLFAITTVAVLPLAWVVSWIGPLDWGTVWGGLLGAWMLAAVCCAIGLAFSAIAAEELVAFLLSAVCLLALWGAGHFVRVLPASIAEMAWYASPTLHFLETGARGVFDARAVVYYALFVACALVLNVVIVEGRRWR